MSGSLRASPPAPVPSGDVAAQAPPPEWGAALAGAPLVTGVEWHETIPSTQTRALSIAEADGPAGTLVVAQTQNAGHGRHGHTWSSPKGGLWCSLAIARPARPLHDALSVTVIAALAAREALRAAAGVQGRLKWPNDLLVGRRKMAGVIAAARAERIVLGIGINVRVRRADLPPDVRPFATSALEEGAADVGAPRVLRALLEALAPRLAAWEAGRDRDLLAEARRLLILEHDVRWRPGDGRPPRDGRPLDLDGTGALLVRFHDAPLETAAITAGDLEILWPTT